MIRNKIIFKRVLLGLAVILLVWLGIRAIHSISTSSPKDVSFIKKASAMIKLADSLTNSKPDSAEVFYHRAINLLKNEENDKNSLHFQSLAYLGLANLKSETGELNMALLNDSVALQIAVKAGDKQMMAKAYLGKGKALAFLGEYEEAINAYQQGMNLASEVKDFEIEAKITANRAIIYAYQGNIPKTIEGFNKALSMGKQSKNQQLIAGNYLNLALAYNNISQNDSVLKFYNYALQTYIKANDKSGELLCYQDLGTAAYRLAQYGKAIEYYRLAVKLALEMNDKLNTSKGYQNLAEVYMLLGDYETASSLMFKSIKLKEQIRDKRSLAKGYSGIGDLFFSQNDYKKAILYFEKSLKISLEINSVAEIGINYNNIASVYSALGKSDTAIAYYAKAQLLYKQTEDIQAMSDLFINLGSEYTVLKNYPEAEKYLRQALELKSSLNDNEGLATANHHLANLYWLQAKESSNNSKEGFVFKAEKAGLESYQKAKNLETITVMHDASKVLLEIYNQQGRYKEALKFSMLYNSLNDSLLNKAKIQALTFAEARWNVEKKQREIDNLEKLHALNTDILRRKIAEARQQKIIIWFIIALFVLAGIASVIVSLYIRKRRDAVYKKQLADIMVLRMQNARNTMSPHFFFNVLSSISGLTLQPEKLKEKISTLSLLLRKMIENIEQTAIPLQDELSSVQAYIELYRDMLPDTFTVEYL